MTNDKKRSIASEADTTGDFERAYAEAAGVAHETASPRISSMRETTGMTRPVDAHTEAREIVEAGRAAAINEGLFVGTVNALYCIESRIATALAAKDAELAKLRSEIEFTRDLVKAGYDKLERTEAQLAEANKALEFADDIICRAEEELRLIHMKDSGVIYDTTLRNLGFVLWRRVHDAIRRASEQGGE